MSGEATGVAQLSPGARVGEYEVVEHLKTSVTADVYVARTGAGQETILKLAHEAARYDVGAPDYSLRSRALMRSYETGVTEVIPNPSEVITAEAKVTAELASLPGGVALLDEGEWHGRRYLVREYVDGQFWDSMLFHGTLHVRHVVELMEHLVELRRHRRFHGDLKPGHLAYDSDGRFRWISPTAGMYYEFEGEKWSDQIFVTPAYRPLNDIADIPSVGIMLAQIICRLVFIEPGPLEVPISNSLNQFCRDGRTLPDSWPMVTHFPVPSHYDHRCPRELERLIFHWVGLDLREGVLDSVSLPRNLNEALDRLRPFADYEPARTTPRFTLHPPGLRLGADSEGKPSAVEIIHEVRVQGRSFWLAEHFGPHALVVLEADRGDLVSVEDPTVLERIAAYLAMLQYAVENPETSLEPADQDEAERIDELVDRLPEFISALTDTA